MGEAVSVSEDYPNLDTLPAEAQYGLLRDRMSAEASQALMEIARLRADNRRYQDRGEVPEGRAVDQGAEFAAIQAQLDDVIRRLAEVQAWMVTQQTRAVPKAQRA